LEVAETLAAGLERVTTADADIVLLDLSLPDAFGLDTYRRAHIAAPHLPIIVLTGNEDEALAVSAVNEGAQDFLSKRKLDGEVLVRSIRYAIERHRLLEQVRQLAIVDDLTGLANRRGFSLLCQHHFDLANRNHLQLRLLFIDVDRFKSINDTFGHQVGDRALADVATVLVQTFRKSDVIARVGGDEFCVLLTQGAAEGARISTERLRASLLAMNLTGDRPYQLSLSVGIGVYDPEQPTSFDELIKRADEAMYAEKSARRQKAS
ncbi:MAG TPA: diguanylate cyclase, partial [Candidatus Eisenbacteria bacterium]|nr:diguanylate cyclase [Candidatus Eisenbacteria bacterium]